MLWPPVLTCDRRMVPIMEHELKNSTLHTRQVPSDPVGTSVETKYAGIMHLSIQPFLGVSARGSRDNVNPNSSNICTGYNICISYDIPVGCIFFCQPVGFVGRTLSEHV